jgi:hypothetical protein
MEVKKNDAKINELVQKKVELGANLRDIQEKIKHLNLELLRNGADAHVALCW